jgi:hypothetical protein
MYIPHLPFQRQLDIPVDIRRQQRQLLDQGSTLPLPQLFRLLVLLRQALL